MAASDIPSGVRSYLGNKTEIFRAVLGDALTGLYLCGSLVQDDFHPDLSDIDLLGVVESEIDEATRTRLIAELSADADQMPAEGLEVVLFPAEAARSPSLDFPFAFALSVGREWNTECEPPGLANDMLIDVALCREHGLVLAGRAIRECFGAVALPHLRTALIEELEWHLAEIDNDSSERAAANAILNAVRSLHAAKTGEILSKTEGGQLWLRRHPADALIAHALAVRSERTRAEFDRNAVHGFVQTVVAKIRKLAN